MTEQQRILWSLTTATRSKCNPRSERIVLHKRKLGAFWESVPVQNQRPGLQGYNERVLWLHDRAQSAGLQLLGLALGVNEHIFHSYSRMDDTASCTYSNSLRLVHYPPTKGQIENAQFSSGAHTDFGLNMYSNGTPVLYWSLMLRQWLSLFRMVHRVSKCKIVVPESECAFLHATTYSSQSRRLDAALDERGIQVSPHRYIFAARFD